MIHGDGDDGQNFTFLVLPIEFLESTFSERSRNRLDGAAARRAAGWAKGDVENGSRGRGVRRCQRTGRAD